MKALVSAIAVSLMTISFSATAQEPEHYGCDGEDDRTIGCFIDRLEEAFRGNMDYTVRIPERITGWGTDGSSVSIYIPESAGPDHVHAKDAMGTLDNPPSKCETGVVHQETSGPYVFKWCQHGAALEANRAIYVYMSGRYQYAGTNPHGLPCSDPAMPTPVYAAICL